MTEPDPSRRRPSVEAPPRKRPSSLAFGMIGLATALATLVAMVGVAILVGALLGRIY